MLKKIEEDNKMSAKKVTFVHVASIDNKSNTRIYKIADANNRRVYFNRTWTGELFKNRCEGSSSEKLHLKRNDNVKSYSVDTPDKYSYVAVSDATSHVERLVFPAWSYRRGYVWVNVNVAGYFTFLTHGGDIRSVKQPEVYFRMLAKANGYQYARAANFLIRDLSDASEAYELPDMSKMEELCEEVLARKSDVLDEMLCLVEKSGFEKQGIEKDLEVYRKVCDLLAHGVAFMLAKENDSSYVDIKWPEFYKHVTKKMGY